MAIHSIVIARETWDTRDLAARVLGEDGKIREERLSTRFDPEDLNALETALQIKDKHGGKVTVLGLGEPRQMDVLRECLYRGVDEVIRLAVPSAAALDTQSQAALFARAIRKIGAFDLVLSGVAIEEGANSLLGAHVAALLTCEPVTWVDGIEEIGPSRVVARRAIEMGYESIEAPLPAVLVVGVALLKEDPRAPRSAKAALKLKHKKTQIPVWTSASLELETPDASRTTRVAGYEPIAERTIDTRTVDPADEAQLAAMLDAIVKGA